MIDERLLWLAVLELAIMDLRNRKERPALRYLTELWFRSSKYAPGSFLWVCDALDLDPSWLRRRLFALVDRPDLWPFQRAIREPQRERVSGTNGFHNCPTINDLTLTLTFTLDPSASIVIFPTISA